MGKEAPIGVFDSGVGGLTVAREIMRQMPAEKIVYFGDTARVPYGSKSPATILRYSRQIVEFLKTQEVKAIVVACNTASALALPTIRGEVEVPILGVVEPGAREAAAVSRNGRIGVIGTDATVRSGIYPQTIKALRADATVFGQACPLLCPLVEEGMTHDFVTDEIITRYLEHLMNKDIDTLILGCTHYPLLRSTFRRILGDRVTLVNPAYETARALRGVLEGHDLIRETEAEGEEKYRFYVSDGADKFRSFARSILPYDVREVIEIQIEDF